MEGTVTISLEEYERLTATDRIKPDELEVLWHKEKRYLTKDKGMVELFGEIRDLRIEVVKIYVENLSLKERSLWKILKDYFSRSKSDYLFPAGI